MTTEVWYSRPVLFVSDIQRALAFYTGTLAFDKRWHTDDGSGTVCQVDRGGSKIILCEDATRSGGARLFIELNRSGIDTLRQEIAARTIPFAMSWWGYDVIRIVDPDGNEFLFPLDETNDRERAESADGKTGEA